MTPATEQTAVSLTPDRLPYSRELAMRLKRELGLNYATVYRWRGQGWIPLRPSTIATARMRRMQMTDETTMTLKVIFGQPQPILHAKALGKLLHKRYRIPEMVQDIRGLRLPRHVLRPEESLIIAEFLDAQAARFGLAAAALADGAGLSQPEDKDYDRIVAAGTMALDHDAVNVRVLMAVAGPALAPAMDSLSRHRGIALKYRTAAVYTALSRLMTDCQRRLLGLAPSTI